MSNAKLIIQTAGKLDPKLFHEQYLELKKWRNKLVLAPSNQHDPEMVFRIKALTQGLLAIKEKGERLGEEYTIKDDPLVLELEPSDKKRINSKVLDGINKDFK
jgi:hypothetical protein